jgi:hypothetical protein
MKLWVCIVQLLNQMTNFHEAWYEHYSTEGQLYIIPFK